MSSELAEDMGIWSMIDSLRLRLLAWFAGLVMLVVAIVGATVCWMTWRSRVATIDAELYARAGSVASAVRPVVGGGFDVELTSEATAYFQSPTRRPYYAVWSAAGSLVDRSDPDIVHARVPAEAARTRGNSREVVVRSRGLTVLIGRDISDVWNELWSLSIIMMSVAVAGVAAALAGGWFLAGRALAPVQRINEAARRMAEGDLTARIEVERTETELGQVAKALNVAFDRQQQSMDRQRRFSADASHQLRTPVATMIAEVDWALRRERDGAQYRESLETCRRASARMQSLVDGLLLLARADSGELAIRRDTIRVDRIVGEAVDMLRPLAQARDVSCSVAASAVSAVGDADRLHELVTNLLVNGIAYNRTGGAVAVDVARDGGWAVVRVRDTGIGIAPEELPRIFDRFSRGESAREREPAGAGLGLAVAHSIAAAHGGSVACASELGASTEFVVRLPAAAAPVPADSSRVSASLSVPQSLA